MVLDQYTIIEAKRTRQFIIGCSISVLKMWRGVCRLRFCHRKYYADVAGTPFSAQSKEFAVIAKKL